MDEAVTSYLLDIVRATREHPSVLLGASPRAALAFVMAAKAYAFLDNRDYVLPDDVKALAPYVLTHRLLLRPEARLDSSNAQSVLQAVLRQVHVPVRMERP